MSILPSHFLTIRRIPFLTAFTFGVGLALALAFTGVAFLAFALTGFFSLAADAVFLGAAFAFGSLGVAAAFLVGEARFLLITTSSAFASSLTTWRVGC